MSDENENNESTTDENVEAAPAADSIEAAANTAAAEAPATTPEPEPEPPVEEPPAAQDKPKKAGAAGPTKRKRQTAGKPSTDTKASVDHLATKKAAADKLPRAKAPEPTEAELAEVDAKKANRERLREIKMLLEEMDADRAALVDERQMLAQFGQKQPDNRPHHVRHAEVLKRSKEIREQRKNDRLKLLAAGAGKSPLDRALGDRPRQSMAAADAKAEADADKTE